MNQHSDFSAISCRLGHLAACRVISIAACLLLGCGTWVGNPDNGDDESKKVNPSGTTMASDSAVLSLDAVPNLESFLGSSQSSLGLHNGLSLAGDSYGLSSTAEPLFVDIGSDLAVYLTGDMSVLTKNIETDQKNQAWTDMKGKLGTFFEAETKCAVMEHTARVLERLKSDSAPLCLLQAVGPVGDKVYRVASGEPIADLTKVFAQGETDRVLQIGLTDKKQPRYEIVQISGSAGSPSGFHVVYTTCLSASKKAFLQHTLDIDNSTGAITFKSVADGTLDDRGPKPNGSFTLSGYLTRSDSGVFLPDATKAREVSYQESGLRDMRSGVTEASLKLIENELSATFFSAESGIDKQNRAFSRTDKTSLDVQYTGTGVSDLVIYQGAGRSIMGFTGTDGGSQSIANANDRIIGFDFDRTKSPQYTTATSSSYLDNVAAVDFAADTILSKGAPSAPDMAAIDSTPCTVEPTTVLNYVDRPEEDGTYRQAQASCNAAPAENVAKMCDALRDLERTVNDAMNDRKTATGSATN